MFGGTFDPIHSAHLEIARRALARYALDRVLLIPAGNPPHKREGAHAPYADRIRMAEIGCRGEPCIEVSRLEEGTSRSYSIETIERVRATLAASDQLYFLIGADAFSEIRTWKRWQDVARAVRFIVASRAGCSFEAPPEVSAEQMDDVDIPVSSTSVRAMLAAGQRPPEVPTAVIDYIREHGLYREA